MSAMLQDAPEVLGAYKQYKDFSADPAIRERVRVRQRFLDEQQIWLGDAHAEGVAKKARETAKNLDEMGLSPSDIARATGLPVSEVESILKKIR